MLQLIERAEGYANRTAIVDAKGEYSYATLLRASKKIARQLLDGQTDLKEARIGFMVMPGFDYVKTQWGIWRAGGIAVPICVTYPTPSILYLIEDAQISALICAPEFAEILNPLAQAKGLTILSTDDEYAPSGYLPDIDPARRAMILYTSGTTGNPKGVVSKHQAIEAQIQMLVKAWQWQSEDHILNILPLHHVHGIINVLSCALWSGASNEFLPKFDAAGVFHKFLLGKINLFMAVPTIYYKLIAHYESMSEEEQQAVSARLRQFRLMVSGSAALPISTLERWRTISGQTLLERYGMTEMGMAISNPYDGERRPGHIGQALPGVEIRIADESDKVVNVGDSGEIQVKGPNVFDEYWNKPEATAGSFTEDGWFRTGDIALMNEGSYRILGRNSVDIIKSGGYKISALEIEEVLRRHPKIKDCGVIGIPDEEWGEVVAASLVLAGENIDFEALKNWLREQLPAYKTPRKFIVQDDLPRNAMGKVTKKALLSHFE